MTQEQDKGMTLRLVIAVAVAIVAMLAINWIFGGGDDEVVVDDVPAAVAEDIGERPVGGDSIEADPVVVTTPAATAVDERLITIETELARYTLSSYGGAYKSVELKEFEEYSGEPLVLFDKVPGELYPGMISIEGFPAWTTYRSDLPSGVYHLSGGEELAVTYTAEVGQVRVTKRYTFRGDSYVGYLELTTSGVPTTARNIVLELGTGLDRRAELAQTVSGLLSTIAVVDGSKFEESPGDNKDKREEWGKLGVISINDNHFTLSVKPEGDDVFYGQVALVSRDAEPKIARTTLTAQASEDGRFRRRFLTYIGPKYYSALEALGIGKVADYGWNFLAPIAIGMLKLLNLFYAFLMNYGLAIILLTIVIKIVLLPLTNRSFRSTMAMQMLQPKIEAIKERYGDDKQRMNEEVMALYKKNKVSPLGGCLPLLLQMPVFIALFGVLRNSVELRGASFLWIGDLTLPDALFSWGVNIPLIGASFNLLPLLMIGAMWYQGQMTAKHGGKQTGFTKFMPIIFGLLFYQMPSGLVLYWLANTLLTLLQQHFILKSYKEKHGVPEVPVKAGPAEEKRLRAKAVEAPRPEPKRKARAAGYDVACEKCGNQTDWGKTYRVRFRGVELDGGDTADVDGVYCPRCGAALALALDDDKSYSLSAGDPETPIPALDDRSWGRELPKNLRDRSHYKKLRTK